MLLKAEQTIARLEKIQFIEDTYDEAQELDEYRSQLESIEETLNGYAAKFTFLRKNSVPIPSIEQTSQVLEILTGISKKFKDDPKRTTLVQGKRWNTLTNRIGQLESSLEGKLKSAWQQFFDTNYFSGLAPDKRSATLAKTPKNKDALTDYTKLYNEFIKHRNFIPEGTDDLKFINKLSDQLKAIKFQDDVPPDVKMFLDSVQIGASLELLTPPVISWLDKNNLTANYIIRAR